MSESYSEAEAREIIRQSVLIEEAYRQGRSDEKYSLAYAPPVFEEAHTPTDDEREAMAHLIGYELYAEQMAKAAGGRPDRSGFDSLGVVFKDTWLDLTRPIAEVILAAGFRRSADPEPQGEPSDAPSYNPDGKTVAATVDWVKRNYAYLPGQDDEYVGQIIDALEAAHAALRAASAVTEQGENR